MSSGREGDSEPLGESSEPLPWGYTSGLNGFQGALYRQPALKLLEGIFEMRNPRCSYKSTK